MPNYLMNKVFIEAKYSDNILFNDMMILQQIINDLSQIMPEYNYDEKMKTLILINSERQFNTIINKNRIEINCDSQIEFNDFKHMGQNILEVLVNKLSIKNFIRIGMRTFRGIISNNMDQAKKYVWKNYIKIKPSDFTDIGNADQCAVKFSILRGKYKINLSIMPNRYQMLQVQNGKVINNINKPEIVIDSDIYIDNSNNVEEILNYFIDDVIKINNNEINNFVSKVGIYN